MNIVYFKQSVTFPQKMMLMKTILFVAAFLLTIKLSAQLPAYHKMIGDTNRWYVSGHFLGVKPGGVNSTSDFGRSCIGYYEAIKDSVFNLKTYKIFKLSTGGSSVCLGFGPNDSYFSSLVREDTLTRKVYIIPKDSANEVLAFDFLMNVGDSLYLPFPATSSVLKNGYYKLDSILLKNEILGQRKHFYLSQYNASINFSTGKKYYIEWIESIGGVHFPLNLVYADNMIDNGGYTCKTYQYNSYVTCKHTNSIKYYQDSCMLNYAQTHAGNGYYFSGDSCEFYGFSGNVKELSFVKNFELFPNPLSRNKITLKFEATEFKPIDIIIYNNLGEKVLTKHLAISTTKNEIELDDLELSTGLYTLQIKGSSESVAIKFVKY